MSGSFEETPVQKGTRSALADLLNSVALPADKNAQDRSLVVVNGAAHNHKDIADEAASTDAHMANRQNVNGHVAHNDSEQSQSSAHEQQLEHGQHRGAAMNIWGEPKKGNAARMDAVHEEIMSTSDAVDGKNAHAAHSAADAAAKWGAAGNAPENNGEPISIKGRADGIAIEIGRGSWSELMEQLTQRLGAAAGFFRGGKVTLNVGMRPLQESELQQVRQLLERFGMTLGLVRSSSEQTCQAALAQGLAANLDAADGIQAQAALTNHDSLTHFVYRGNLRSGQILKRAETVLVLGDVNPGAQVISDGDILIWGRLRGIAHAGCAGDANSISSALSMEPTHLRIAGLIAVLPEGKGSSWMGKLVSGREMLKRPEIAYIADEQIVVDAWDQSKPGGVMAYRR
ncbi:MAG: septum site-determining protein MinC [Caldilineaceae bacterium]